MLSLSGRRDDNRQHTDWWRRAIGLRANRLNWRRGRLPARERLRAASQTTHAGAIIDCSLYSCEFYWYEHDALWVNHIRINWVSRQKKSTFLDWLIDVSIEPTIDFKIIFTRIVRRKMICTSTMLIRVESGSGNILKLHRDNRVFSDK